MNYLQNLSNREKILLFALALVLILFMGIQFLIRPAATTLLGDTAVLAATQASAQQVLAQEKMVSGTQNTVQSTYSQAVQSTAWLFSSLDKPDIQLWLMKIAKQSGLSVQSVAIGDSAAQTGDLYTFSGTSSGAAPYNMKVYADAYSGITDRSAASSAAASATASAVTNGDLLTASVNLQMSGSYGSTQKFLDAIKKSGKAAVVTAFSFSKADKTGSCTATLQLYAAQKLDASDKTFEWTQSKPAGQNALIK